MTLRAPLRVAPALLALTLAAACSKDAPKEPTPAPPPAPAAASPAAPGEAPVAPKPAAAPAEAAPQTPPATPAAPTGAEHALAPISLPRFDPAIAAVAAVPSLDALAEALQRAAATAGDLPLPPAPLEAALEALRMRFRLADTRWIDTARPLRLAVPDPKAHPDGFAVIVPLRGGEDALRAGLGEALAAAPEHFGRLGEAGAPGTAYVDLLEGHAVFTSHADLFAQLTAYAREVLLPWTPTSPLVIEVSVSNLRRAFAAELDQARASAAQFGDLVTQRANIPVQAATVKALIEGTFGFVDGADRLGVALDAVGPRVRVAFGLRGVEGSTLATTLTGLDGRTAGLLAAVPPTAWLGFVSNFPASLTVADRATLLEQLRPSTAALSDAERERLVDHLLGLSAATTGDAAQAVAIDGAFPFAWSAVLAVNDRAKARAALVGLLDLALQRGLAEVRAQISASGATPPPLATLDDAVTLLNGFGQALGAEVSLKQEDRDGTHVAGLVVGLDWSRMGLARTDPAVFETLKSLVGDQLGVALADADGRLALALGPHALDQAAALAAGRFPGGEPTLDRAGRGAVFALSLRVGAMLKALSGLPSLKSRASLFAALPQDQALSLSAAASAGTLVVTFDAAVPLFTALVR